MGIIIYLSYPRLQLRNHAVTKSLMTKECLFVITSPSASLRINKSKTKGRQMSQAISIMLLCIISLFFFFSILFILSFFTCLKKERKETTPHWRSPCFSIRQIIRWTLSNPGACNGIESPHGDHSVRKTTDISKGEEELIKRTY